MMTHTPRLQKQMMRDTIIGLALLATPEPDKIVITGEKFKSHGNDRLQRETPRIQSNGRNKPCTCGSGKKFKKCHGAPAAHEPVDAQAQSA